MLEILLIATIFAFIPFASRNPIMMLLVIAVVLPGTYATWKGAPFLPTPLAIVKKMIDAAKLKKGEKAYDLGCGDGRIVRAAAKAGAKAVGYELSVPTCIWGWLCTIGTRNASIRFGNFWKKNVSDADVIFCYLLTDTMGTFHKIVWPQLKLGTRVVSHTFRMKDVEPEYQDKDVVVYVKK